MSAQVGSAEVGIYPLFVLGGKFGNDIDSGLPDITHIPVSYTHLGLMPAGELIKMMVIQAVLKTLYEIISCPLPSVW